MHPIEVRITEIKNEAQELRSRANALDALLPGLEEALRISNKNTRTVANVSEVNEANQSVSIDNMRRGTRIIKILETLNVSKTPMRPQAIADLLEYSNSKPVRTMLHIAKGRGLVAPSGNRSYVISELGKELLIKKTA